MATDPAASRYRARPDGDGLAAGVLLLVLAFVLASYRTPPTGPLVAYELAIEELPGVSYALSQVDGSRWIRRVRCTLEGRRGEQGCGW